MPLEDSEIKQHLLELKLQVLQLCEAIADLYDVSSGLMKTTAGALNAIQALILTGCELNPQFRETMNRALAQAEDGKATLDAFSSKKEKIDALLKAMAKKSGSETIQ